MTFRPSVLLAEPHHELRWLGRVLVPGLLDGEHSFELEPLVGGRTRVVQSERFSGLLLRLFRSMLGATELGLQQMNCALKAEAEGRSGP